MQWDFEENSRDFKNVVCISYEIYETCIFNGSWKSISCGISALYMCAHKQLTTEEEQLCMSISKDRALGLGDHSNGDKLLTILINDTHHHTGLCTL